MRIAATCPKCSGKKILVTELRFVASGDTWTGVHLIPAVAYNVKGFAKGPESVGRFDSWICAGCGYTEFYAKDLGDVDQLAAQRPGDVRVVDATDRTKDPFR